MGEWLEYVLFRLLALMVRKLSFRAAGIVGGVLGRMAFSILRIRRSITLDNLSKAFPQSDRRQLEGIALGAYKNYAITLAHMLWSGGVGADQLKRVMRVGHPDAIRELMKQGRGVILLSGHFGGWELLISSLRLHLGEPMVIIVQHQRNGKIDRFIDAQRRRFENITVPMGPSVREVLKALQEGKVVAMLGDQSGAKESIFVNFFGRPSATHRGTAAFSLRTGAPILMVFLVRQPDGSYEAEFEAVDRSGLAGSSEENIMELTQRHVAVLEKHIRQHPEQWLWMHKRWKHTGYYESLHKDARTGSTVEAGT